MLDMFWTPFGIITLDIREKRIGIFWGRVGNMLDICWEYFGTTFGNGLETCCKWFGVTLDMVLNCFENTLLIIWRKLRTCCGNMLEMRGTDFGDMPGIH